MKKLLVILGLACGLFTANMQWRTIPNLSDYEHRERELSVTLRRKQRVVQPHFAAQAFQLFCEMGITEDVNLRALMGWTAQQYACLAGCCNEECPFDRDAARIALWHAPKQSKYASG